MPLVTSYSAGAQIPGLVAAAPECAYYNEAWCENQLLQQCHIKVQRIESIDVTIAWAHHVARKRHKTPWWVSIV